MTIVRARITPVGEKGKVEDIVFVDTEATLTLVDRSIAERAGIGHTGRRIRLVAADDHKVEVELAVVNKLIVEDEELPYAHVAVVKLDESVKAKLRQLGRSDWCVLGLTTLKLLQPVPDITTGTLQKTNVLFL